MFTPKNFSHAASQTSADFDQLTTPARLPVSPPLHLSIYLASPAFRLCRKLFQTAPEGEVQEVATDTGLLVALLSELKGVFNSFFVFFLNKKKRELKVVECLSWRAKHFIGLLASQPGGI